MAIHSEYSAADQVSSELSEQFGAMTQENGLSRTAGRIFGLLMLSGAPLSFSDIAKQLAVSRGGLSSNTRLLAAMGLIERVTKAGDRQDYFQVPATVWSQQITRQLQRDQQALGHVQDALKFHATLPPAAFQRLATLEMILNRSVHSCQETLAMLELQNAQPEAEARSDRD